MTITDTIKHAVGLGDEHGKFCQYNPPPPYTQPQNTSKPPRRPSADNHLTLTTDGPPETAPTSREAMSTARLPIPYRDSCAHLLIPLNRCRFEEYYLPWKCEVRFAPLHGNLKESVEADAARWRRETSLVLRLWVS